MREKTYFLAGFAAGLIFMCGIAAGFIGIRNHILWSGQMPPDVKISRIFSHLDNHSIYPFERDELMEDMYRGLLDGVGDPYTYYFDKESLAVFTEKSEGTYVGIGVVVSFDREDRTTTITAVYPGTPAEEAGLQLGDKLMMVNGNDMVGKPMEEVTNAVRGPAGTKVTVTVYRPLANDTFDMAITRRSVDIPTVSHKMLDGVIGYIRIEGFEGVTFGQFEKAIEDLKSQQMRGLIIDVRNNPGGRMKTVTDIANLLLPKGIITYTEDVNGKRENYISDEKHLNIPLVMLVNEHSASASEVLGGAVRDLGAGVLVGTKTFGKGIVQSLYYLADGSAVKITIAKYFTPNGVCIQGEGLKPDFIVEMEPEKSLRAGRLELEEDTQLQKAIAVMWQKLI